MASKLIPALKSAAAISIASYLFDPFNPENASMQNVYAACIAGVTTVVGTKLGSNLGFIVAKELKVAPSDKFDWKYSLSGLDKVAFVGLLGGGLLAGGAAGYKGSKEISKYILSESKEVSTLMIDNFLKQDNQMPQNRMVLKL